MPLGGHSLKGCWGLGIGTWGVGWLGLVWSGLCWPGLAMYFVLKEAYQTWVGGTGESLQEMRELSSCIFSHGERGLPWDNVPQQQQEHGTQSTQSLPKPDGSNVRTHWSS